MNPTFTINPKLEKDLDVIIKRNMKGESYFSPLNFSPLYQQDNLSRLKLRGYREHYYNPFFPDYTNQLNNIGLLNINSKNERKNLNKIGSKINEIAEHNDNYENILSSGK